MYDHHLVTKIVDIGETLHSADCPPYKLEKYVEHYARNRSIEVTVMAYANFINFQNVLEKCKITKNYVLMV